MSEENEHSTEPETLPADIFNRESIAQAMSRILCEFDRQDVSPAVLNGPWGCGKSTHALRMKKIIERDYGERYKCIYWNAATVDYAKEPLPVFLSALSRQVPENKKEAYARRGLFLCGWVLGAITSVASQITEQGVGVNARQVMTDAMQDARDCSASDAVVENFKQFLDTAVRDEERMASAAELITLAGEGKELFIIIDELDRCRPNFALSMLESMKHLFSHARCRFLLVMNKVSMVSSIQHLYGLDENQASLYLNKFITQDFSLPSSTRGRYEEESCPLHYFKILLENEKYPRTFVDDITENFITTVFRNNNFQLREIEKLVRAMAVLQRQVKGGINASNSRYHTLQVCWVAYLMAFYPNLLFELMVGSISERELLIQTRCFINTGDQNNISEEALFYLENLLRASMERNPDQYRRIVSAYETNHSHQAFERDVRAFISLLSYVPVR